MRAMILARQAAIESRPLASREVPDPAPGPGEVRLRVSACAICRTDLHVIEGDLDARKLPVIPGHQVVGRVDALGEGSRRFATGQRVGVAWLRQTCGFCRFCMTGRENLCEASNYTGWTADGGFAEYAVVPEKFAYALPDDLADVDAAPLLCSGIIGYRAYHRAEVKDGSTVALFGFGSSAHVILQLAKGHGCRVFVATRGERHQQLARSMGADWVGGTFERPSGAYQSAIVFAPAGDLVPVALEGLDKGGTLALAGIVMSQIPPLDYERHLFYEKNVRTVTSNTRVDGENLLREAMELRIRPHVTTWPLAEANEALQALKADRIQGTGVLLC